MSKTLLLLCEFETHSSPQVLNNELKFPRYEIFCRDRPTRGGGILVAIRSIKGVQIINFSSESNEEMLILRLSIHGFSFCMVAYYLPPGSTRLCDLFLNSLRTIQTIILLCLVILTIQKSSGPPRQLSFPNWTGDS